MLKSTIKNIRMHEHAGRVAIDWEGIPTFYLSTDQARELSQQLALASSQIEQAYHYPTTYLQMD